MAVQAKVPQGGARVETTSPQRHFPAMYVLLLACLFVFGLTLIVPFLSSEFRTTLNQEKTLLTYASDDTAQDIRSWVAATNRQAAGFSRYPVMTAAVSSLDPAIAAHAREILNKIIVPFAYVGMYVTDADGKVIVQTSGAPELEPWLQSQAARLTEPRTLTCFEPAANPGFPKLVFVQPIYAQQKRTRRHTGALIVITPPGAIAALMDTPASRVHSLLLARNPEGQVVYFTRSLLAPHGIVPRDEIAQAALRGERRFGARRGRDGTAQYAVSNYISELGWGMITREPRNAALAPFVRTAIWAVSSYLTICALLVAVAYALWRHQLFVALRAEMQQRQRFEEEIQQSEECFNTAFRCAPEGMALSRLSDGCFIEVNESFARIFGYSHDEVVGRTSIELGLWKDSAARARLLGGAGNDSQNVRTQGRTKDGREIELEISAERVRIRREDCLIFNIQDITPRLMLQEQLRQAHKMEAVGLLAGTVAHDFNNLLMAISSQAELLLGAADVPTALKARRILSATDSAALLTRKLLAFGRKQELAATTFDMNDFVSHICDLISGLLPRDVKLECRLADTPCWVRTDQGQLEQTIINLVINARDAMPEGGKLVLGTARVCIGAGEVLLHSGVPEGSYALLTVADTGCGIPPENLERIFEPFFTTKPKERGTGLGLSMAYGIVRQSGGYLRVRSAVGAGTTFSIYLPPSGEEDSDVLAAAASRTGGGVPRVEGTVLVIDDEEMIRTSIKIFLEDIGLTVMACASGEEALHVAEELDSKLAMLVTDVVMPGISGKEVASVLVDRRPDLPIIFMSGYAASDSGEKRFKHAKFLQKPFSRAGLIATVRDSLDS